MLGAASAVPLLSASVTAQPVVAASYNRYMYGLAVFHARTRASISAVDLGARLRVSGAVVDAMMREMTQKGVLTPALHAVAGTMRAVSPNGAPGSRVSNLAKRAVDALLEEPDERPAENTGQVEEQSDVAPGLQSGQKRRQPTTTAVCTLQENRGGVLKPD